MGFAGVGPRETNKRMLAESFEQPVGSKNPMPGLARTVKVIGGGGIRTRVRKYIPAGIYDAYPLLMCRSRREEAAKNRRKPTPENLAADV
jgi:hypothetical protein